MFAANLMLHLQIVYDEDITNGVHSEDIQMQYGITT